MKHPIVRSFATAGLIVAGLALASPDAKATLTISSSVGGSPTGVSYANFDNLSTGTAGGVSGNITVSFIPDGQAVTGASSGVYAAPFVSNGNGVNFGNPDGVDTTVYLTTGTGKVILSLPGPQMYLGLLWGSVDSYNTLTFYSGGINGTSVGSVTGSDVLNQPNGDQGVNGTAYVNINSTLAFDTVVATSTSNAFEFDNVAFNPTAVTPEPGTVAMLVSGVPIALMAWLRRRRPAPAA